MGNSKSKIDPHSEEFKTKLLKWQEDVTASNPTLHIRFVNTIESRMSVALDPKIWRYYAIMKYWEIGVKNINMYRLDRITDPGEDTLLIMIEK